mmetsp:Transcript_17223/g.48053  ORF Transcript_17223/g.48053 Transcript_17223/m.48053 type:complete len:299 (+) Transcript_17223:627-1523(+)
MHLQLRILHWHGHGHRHLHGHPIVGLAISSLLVGHLHLLLHEALLLHGGMRLGLSCHHALMVLLPLQGGLVHGLLRKIRLHPSHGVAGPVALHLHHVHLRRSLRGRGLLGKVLHKVLVPQSLVGSNTLARSIGQHALHQVHARRVESWHQRMEVLWAPLGERVFVIRQLAHAGPDSLVWCTHDLEHVEQLSDLVVTGKQRAPADHLCKDAANGPHVDRCGVVLCTQQNLRGAVPQGDHLVRVGSHRDTKGSCQAKVSELQYVPLTVDEQVLRLQVTVEDAVSVTVGNPADHLEKVIFD